MPDNESYMVDLLHRYLKEGLAGEEQSVFKRWLASGEANRQLLGRVMNKRRLKRQLLKYHRIDAGAAFLRLQQRHPELRADGIEQMVVDRKRAGEQTAGMMRRRVRTIGQTVSAIRIWIGSHWQLAGLVLGVGVFLYLGTYLVQIYRRLKLEGNLSYRHAHYTPAGHFAELLLADGSNYELASVSAGNLQELGCVVFSKSSDSSMSMTLIPGCNNKHSETYPPVRQPASNILSTRNGGYFSAGLVDGTKVRLNAASSLRFPTVFAKTKREVFLEGEGFFDVASAAKNDNVPFVVHVFVHRSRDVGSGRADVLADTLTIVSLGTRFDIEAYPGEGGIRTRLQEGGLLLKTGDQQLSLSAGQTAIFDDKGRLKLDNKTSADTTYWEKGQFLFVEEPATQILDELSRWYDVRFVYRVNKSQEPFTLKGFNRSAPLKDLLDELESMSDLHFQKSGDTVVYVLR
jgi:ferric-dicitrate binding protein FerR (iron transport regulator)